MQKYRNAMLTIGMLSIVFAMIIFLSGSKGFASTTPFYTFVVGEIYTEYYEKENVAPKKPVLGIIGRDVVSEFIRSDTFPSSGAYVEEVLEYSVAQISGIEPSDIIVGFGEEKISSMEQLFNVIIASIVGDKVDVSIYRNGELIKLEVILSNYTVK